MPNEVGGQLLLEGNMIGESGWQRILLHCYKAITGVFVLHRSMMFDAGRGQLGQRPHHSPTGCAPYTLCWTGEFQGADEYAHA